MKVDDEYFEIGNIKVRPCKTTRNGKNIENTKSIKIISRDERCSLCLYTIVPISYFNTLPKNEKVNVIDMFDDYDIPMGIDGDFYINSRDNSEIYLTKLDDLKFKLNVIITDFSDVVVSSNDGGYERFELETEISFDEK